MVRGSSALKVQLLQEASVVPEPQAKSTKCCRQLVWQGQTAASQRRTACRCAQAHSAPHGKGDYGIQVTQNQETSSLGTSRAIPSDHVRLRKPWYSHELRPVLHCTGRAQSGKSLSKVETSLTKWNSHSVHSSTKWHRGPEALPAGSQEVNKRCWVLPSVVCRYFME